MSTLDPFPSSSSSSSRVSVSHLTSGPTFTE
jgi:hypothetical protein